MTRSAAPTPHLEAADIIERALDIVEQQGPEALTMRKLARDLGVAPTSIYWHIGGRDDLIAAIIARHRDKLRTVEIKGASPRERVLSAVLAVWHDAMAHPNVTRLAYESGYSASLAMPLEIALARELSAAGLRGEQARDAMRGLLISVGGFLVMALRDSDAVPTDRTSQSMWALVDDPGVESTLQAALQQPLSVSHTVEATLSALVDAVLP